MDDWLATLADPIYGIIDWFLDSPVTALAVTSVLGVLLGVTMVSFR